MDGSLRGYRPEFNFEQSPTVYDFLMSDAFVSGIVGPLGSGKSYGCCCKVMKHAQEQRINAQGWMVSRWGIIRNTYPELRSTTIKTWLDAFPENYCGPIVYSHPITHRIKIPPSRDFEWDDRELGTYIGTPGLDLEVMFLALDTPSDVKHLKSLEFTGVWCNEGSELDEEIIDMLTGRVGRYPAEKDGGSNWAGIIIDTNAADDQNWFHRYAEGDVPDNEIMLEDGSIIRITWRFFDQPPAVLEVSSEGGEFHVSEAGYERRKLDPRQVLASAGRFWCVNPKAENLNNLRAGYYHQQLPNKALDWIERFLQAKKVFMAPGKPWVPEYNDKVMVRKLVLDRNRPLIAGIDCGGGTLNPSAVWGQRGELGDWRVLAELCCFDMGLERFVTLFKQVHAENFGDYPLEVAWIDPAGKGRDEVYETAVEEHLISRGIPAQCAPTNNPVTRREALAVPMGRLITKPSGETLPGFLVNERCQMLRAALGGKWFRRRLQVAGPEKFVERPEKNRWSHVGDAGSYMTLGGGEHMNLKTGATPGGNAQAAFREAAVSNVPWMAETDFNVFGS